MSKQSCDAVIDLAVEGFELGDIELLADQVLMGFLVCLVEDRRNRSESEFLKNLRHKIRLHLAAASDEHHLGAAEHLLVNLQHVQLRHPKQWLNQSTPNNGSTNQP